MSTTAGTVHVRLRPIRLGFLVDPRESAAVREAIGISSFLWGGAFNPIIPAPLKIPRAWRLHPAARTGMKTIIRGFIDAFDPDYIVPLGSCAQRQYDVGNRDCLKPEEILPDSDDFRTPGCGVGLFEILEHLHEEEFRFQQKNPLTLHLPQVDRQYSLFLESVFGAVPQPLVTQVEDVLKEHFGGEILPCTGANYTEFLAPRNLFLRRISSLYVDQRPLGRGWGSGNCAFVLDPSSPSDIIDYWNLRAAGWNVIPVPVQASCSPVTLDFVRRFIERNYQPLPRNPGIHTWTTILKSRSVSEEEVKTLVRAFGIPASGGPKPGKYALQMWQPRVWDEWAQEKDGIECCGLEAAETSHEITAEQIAVPTLDPKFVERHSGSWQARYANEIDLSLYGSREMLAEVIPEGGSGLIGAMGGIGAGEWRFSRHGPVHLVHHAGWTIHISTPKAEDVFKTWLAERGWKAELSSSGHVAREMAKNLGGTWGISRLASEGIIRLLLNMQKQKTMQRRAFWGEIQKIASAEKHPRPLRLLQDLMASGVFKLGVEIRCPICTQTAWYSLPDLNYEVQCPTCYERFPVPSHSPEEMRWAYRIAGPFALPGGALGAYTVLLTLRFFAQLRRTATTPIMSFTAAKDGRTMEVDLGILCRDAVFRERRTELVFAECKTYNKFAPADARRMRQLSDDFPGATLVFATLRKSLTETEKRLLQPVVNRGRRYWKAGRPYTPVLILTGVELYAADGPPTCWKDAGHKYAPFIHRRFGSNELSELCDCTQQLYLDMKPWHEWLKERAARRSGLRRPQSAASLALPQEKTEGGQL